MPGSHSYTNRNNWLAGALAGSIVLGILCAWTPQLWGIAVLHFALLLTGLVWLFGSPIEGWAWPPMQTIPIAIIAVWGWLQMAFLGTVSPYRTKIRAVEWTIIGIAFCLSYQILRRRKPRSIFLATVMWASVSFSLLAVLQMYSSPGQVLWIFPAEQFTVGTFLYKNQFVGMVELATPIALHRMLFRPEKRLLGISAFLAFFGGAVVSGSRAGLILVLVECCVALFLAYWSGKIKLSWLLAVVPAIVLGLGLTALLFGYDTVWQHFQESHPYAIRQELLKSTMQMYRSEPWSGYGLGAWPVVYPAYATFDIGRVANAAHNDWAEWATEGGIVFVGCIALVFASLIKPAIQSVWGLGIISIMLHSWVDYPTREPVLCVFWFCLAGGIAGYAGDRSEFTG